MKHFKVHLRSLANPFQNAAIFYDQWQGNEMEKPDPQRATSIKRAIKLKYVWLSVWKYFIYHSEEGEKYCFFTKGGSLKPEKSSL